LPSGWATDEANERVFAIRNRTAGSRKKTQLAQA
jgi:hypothetical protein